MSDERAVKDERAQVERRAVQMMSAESDLFVLDNYGRIWIYEEDENSGSRWDPLPALPQTAADPPQAPVYTLVKK
jgi:hypothetical protein